MRDELNTLRAENIKVFDSVKTENRSLTAEERDAVTRRIDRMTELNNDIAARQAELSAENAVQRAASKTTIQATIREALARGEKQVSLGVEAGATRAVDLQATDTLPKGKAIVPTIVTDLLPVLRDRMVLVDAGATVLTGLKGNVRIPAYSGSSADWYGENAAASGTAGAFSYKDLTPKRLSAVIEVSNLLLEQDTVGAEQMLLKDIVDAIADKLEKTILGNAAGSTTKPAGIFNGVTAAGHAVPTWADVVDLETAVDTANLLTDRAKYIMATGVYGSMKKTVKATGEGAGFLLDANKQLNGYEVLHTNSVAANGIAFGDWSELVIGQWGDIRLVLDPYTSAANDALRIVVNASFDAVVRRDGAIAKAVISAS